MIYPVSTHKSLLTEVHLVSVVVSEDGIRPETKCEHESCQSDGGICGHFEGLTLDGDAPAAKCSKRRSDA
jgi:hypothetical protein